MIDDMAVYIANLGKYNEGYLVGAWFTFPIDEEDVKEKIGLNEQYEEYAIHDTDNFPIAIGEYVSIEELNGTNILLVIEDNGCGIKASDLSRVFEKGFTGSNRNKANATGMGLYLSKKLCDRLGLKLDIASTEKEYTRLTITFPKGTVHNFSE